MSEVQPVFPFDEVIEALDRERTEALEAHRDDIVMSGLTSRQRAKDPDHIFLAGVTTGYVLGLATAAALIKVAAQEEAATDVGQID